MEVQLKLFNPSLYLQWFTATEEEEKEEEEKKDEEVKSGGLVDHV